MKTLLRHLYTLLLSSLFIHTINAQTTHTWIGGDGSWSDSSNWDTGLIPAATDTAIINRDTTLTVILDVDATIGGIVIGDSTGIQTLSLSGRILNIDGYGKINYSGTIFLTNSSVDGSGILENSGTILAASSTLNLNFLNAGNISFTGNSGIDNISSAITNSGNILVSSGNLTLTQSGINPGFTTTGIFTVSSLGTFTVNGGSFYYNSGTFDINGTLFINDALIDFVPSFLNADTANFNLDNSTLTTDSAFVNQGNLNIVSSTIQGSGLFTNQGNLTVDESIFNKDLHNAGLASFTGDCQINNDLTTQVNSTLQLYSTSGSAAYLTLANGFSNYGLLEFLTDNPNVFGTLDITSNPLVNETGGEILLTTTIVPAYAERILAKLDNRGTMNLQNSLEISKISADHINSGTITLNDGDLTITQSGSTPSFTDTGTITVGNANVLIISGGTFDFSSGIFTLDGSLSVLSASVNFDNSFNNNGTINLSFSTITSDQNFTNNGDLRLTYSTFDGSGILVNAASSTFIQSTLSLDFANAGLALFTGDCSIDNTLTTQSNSTIRMHSTNSSASYLTVTHGFTNNGLIEFISDYFNVFSTLEILSDTLFNASGGEIHSISNGYHTNRILGILDNQGEITPGWFDLDGNLHQGNSGIINMGLRGIAAGTQYDQLNTSGLVYLDGAFNIQLDSGFIPAIGDTFVVMTFSSRSGNFDTINGLDPGVGIAFDTAFTSTAFMLIAIDTTNIPPVAVDDSVTISMDSTTTLNVLDNDYDPDGDPLSIIEIIGPINGAAIILPGDTLLSYTPPPSFVGSDTLQYVISDGEFSDTAKVFITVALMNIAQLNNLNLQISDFQTTSSTITINMDQISFGLVGVEILIDSVLHSATGDLEFTLSHGGTIDTLIYRVGGTGDHFIKTRLSDAANLHVSGGTPPFTGVYKPHQPLKVFSGSDPNGEWTLDIYDGILGNSGTLISWGLVLFYEGATAIDQSDSQIPVSYQLKQNYPNPFNPITNIEFTIPKSEFVYLKVYNILGEEVKTLVSKRLTAGQYKYDWDAGGMASGVYLCRIQAGHYIETRKMVLMK